MRILFLSDDDQCRGPMARAITQRLAEEARLHNITFDSSAMNQADPRQVHVATAAFMLQERYVLTAHHSKPITPFLADEADLIFCMTRSIADRAREYLGPQFAPKVVLYNEAIDLATRKVDIDPPAGESMREHRRLYATLLAAGARLIRMLQETDARPEDFGARAVPRVYEPGHGQRKHKPHIDPEKRRFLANLLFDIIERSVEPERTPTIREQLALRGQQLTLAEIETLLRKDLDGYVRVDEAGVWHIQPGAGTRRRDEARETARKKAASTPKPEREVADSEPVTPANAHEILGLKKGVALDEAQKKYRALLMRYHPDKFHDDPDFARMAGIKVRRINEAWDLLKDALS